MAVRVPQNQIVKSQYTSGKDYVSLNDHKPYIGYYYELNNKTFAGKEFRTDAPEIISIKSKKFNKLLSNPATSLYGKISGIVLNSAQPLSHMFEKTNPNDKYVTRYFLKKVNEQPTIIKEINNSTYKSFQNNSLYKVISIKWDTLGSNEVIIEQTEKQFSGIKSFLENLNISPNANSDDLIYPS